MNFRISLLGSEFFLLCLLSKIRKLAFVLPPMIFLTQDSVPKYVLSGQQTAIESCAIKIWYKDYTIFLLYLFYV